MNKYISSIYTSLDLQTKAILNYCQLWHTAMFKREDAESFAMLASLVLGIPTCHSSLFPQNIMRLRESSQSLTQLW